MIERALPPATSDEYIQFMELNQGFLHKYTNRREPSLPTEVEQLTDTGYQVLPTEGFTLFYLVGAARQFHGGLDDQAPYPIMLQDNPSSEYLHLERLVNSRFIPGLPDLPRFSYEYHDHGICEQTELNVAAALGSLMSSSNDSFLRISNKPITLYVDDNLVPTFMQKYRSEHTGISLRPFYSEELLYPAGTLLSVHTHGEIDRLEKDNGGVNYMHPANDNYHILYDGPSYGGERQIRIIHTDAISSIDPSRLTPWAHEDLSDRRLFAVVGSDSGVNQYAPKHEAAVEAPLSEHLFAINAAIAHYLGVRR